ncbi:MAG: hypothetical protein ACK58M_07240 [Acidobacteriota bacterium]|nr:hypothetical protein [Bryobacteraceae bacterium CoA2 C42]
MQTFNRFRAFRDQMLNIPDRVAGELAGISDAHEIFRILHRREAAKKMGTSER